MPYCHEWSGKMQIIPEEYIWVCEDCGLEMTTKEVTIRDAPLGTIQIWDQDKEVPIGWKWKNQRLGWIKRISRGEYQGIAPQYRMTELETHIRVVLEEEDVSRDD